MGTNHLCHPKKSYIGQTKVAHLSSDGASTWWDHFRETKTEIVISSSPWIHSLSGWKSAPCPLLHSWRATEFLYDNLVARWGKPRCVQTDNGSKFAGSFARLCKGLGIVYHHITIGNSKANGQVKQTIRTLKDCIRRGLTKTPATFWTNHLSQALLLLRMTVSRMTGIAPYLLVMGQQPLLPSITVPGLPSLPDQPTPDKEEAYLTDISRIVEWLQELGGTRIKEAERWI